MFKAVLLGQWHSLSDPLLSMFKAVLLGQWHSLSDPLLSMFKAVLLGQWHSLSDPELEHSLIPASIQPVLPFDELTSRLQTLCRYRNWLAQDDTLSELTD
ncbi:hypothetical protein NM3144_1969 [Neisseria meningitidis NM3144]|nr:hypothetical protein NM3144_1969 [Neisseria meningitidis NM3144]